MARDVTRIRTRDEFVALLRRVADAVERGEPFRVQVGGVRVTVPYEAELSIEHEAEGDAEEIEMQLRWRRGQAESDGPDSQ
ncbi:amphi-Trp domain-containing protein [Polyangium sorediatum]|uniref:Amphi-Trp domain-containing protein n=1 Tax=Polyangium sorediatum TaxID=889274 RepID=A0ABT6P715_9BACT|nr:amphi-Trp domain-containing protein [Polyangium sorediatum]MDI1436420.1 amphi-Trp domain-containing protein [Polyangium sorediatum]